MLSKVSVVTSTPWVRENALTTSGLMYRPHVKMRSGPGCGARPLGMGWLPVCTGSRTGRSGDAIGIWSVEAVVPRLEPPDEHAARPAAGRARPAVLADQASTWRR